MKRSLTLLGIFVFVGIGSLHCANTVNGTSIDPEKRKLCEQLFVLTGEDNLVHQLMNSMISSSQKNKLKVPNGFWEDFKFRINEESGEFIEEIIPIWSKYYSTEDLKGLIQFYSSPLGRKLISEQPEIMEESSVVGRAWGEKIAREVEGDFRKNK